MRRHYGVAGVDLPFLVIEIQRNIRVKAVHVSFPQGVDSSDILPVSVKVVCHQLAALVEHCGDYVLSEVLGRALVVLVGDKVTLERSPCEDVNAH